MSIGTWGRVIAASVCLVLVSADAEARRKKKKAVKSCAFHSSEPTPVYVKPKGCNSDTDALPGARKHGRHAACRPV